MAFTDFAKQNPVAVSALALSTIVLLYMGYWYSKVATRFQKEKSLGLLTKRTATVAALKTVPAEEGAKVYNHVYVLAAAVVGAVVSGGFVTKAYLK